MSKAAASIEELFPLVDSCRAGDLDAVAAWIAAGKPINPPPNKKTRRPSPLAVAIEKDFLTLTKVLLDGGADPMAGGNALGLAVDRKRVDIARLLITRGAPVESVSFAWVARTGNADMIRLFIEKGADVATGDPFFHALTESLRPLLPVYKEFRERFPDWQRQINMALVHYIREKSPQSVALLVWAGAQPDVEIVDPRYDTKETPIEIAAQEGDLGLLKALKPENFPALLGRVLRATWLHPSRNVLEYLVGIGAPVNEPAGGSELLDLLIRHGLADWPGDGGSRAEQAFQAIEFLCQRGARWSCQTEEPVKWARHALKRTPAERLARLVPVLVQHKAAPSEFLAEVLETPGMKKQLGHHAPTVERLLHPPAPKMKPPPVAAPKAPLSTPEVLARAEEWLLRKMANHGLPHFSTTCWWDSWAPSALRKPFGLDRQDERDPLDLLRRACASLQRRLKTVRLEYPESNRGYRNFTVELKSGHEWRDFGQEVHDALGIPYERPTSPPKVAAMNPVCDLSLDHVTRTDFKKYQELIIDLLLQHPPKGSEAFIVWHFTDRAEFQRCFPRIAFGDPHNGPSYRLAEFFNHLPIPAGLKRSFDVQNNAAAWQFSVHPATSWEKTIPVLKTERAQPSMAQRYELSQEAGTLLEWLLSLPEDRKEAGWSPPIESCNTREIGLKSPGGTENLPFYVQILLDEINARSPYDVRPFSWKEYSSNKTRLKLSPKPSDFENLVRQIQWHGLQRQQLLDSETVRTKLLEMLGDGP